MGIFNKRKVTNDTRRVPVDTSDTCRTRFNWSPLMTVEEMLSNTTVASCVEIISDAVAQLSLNVYKKTDNGRMRDDTPNLAYLFHKAPNYEDTPYTFKQTLMLHLLLKGNAFIFIERYPDYTVKSLTPLDPEKVSICRDSTNNGEVYYKYRVNGLEYKYTKSCILHIPAMKYNKLRGLSPMEYATHAAKLGLTLDEYTNDSFDGGIHSKLMVTVPQEERNWNKDDSQKLSERLLSAYGGRENANKPLILSKGLTAQPLNLVNNADNRLVENRSFSEKEIAKIFRVPLFMLGSENSKFTNMEQANTYFLQHTLTPWIVRIQEYFDRLLTEPYKENYYVEFDTDTMIRADYTSRWNAHRENFKAGLFTLNQIMDMENLPRIDAPYGDEHFGLENYKPLSQSMKADENKND